MMCFRHVYFIKEKKAMSLRIVAAVISVILVYSLLLNGDHCVNKLGDEECTDSTTPIQHLRQENPKPKAR